MMDFNGATAPNLTRKRKIALEAKPSMMCWLLYLESDVAFKKFITEHRGTIHRISGDFLTISVFVTEDKSSDAPATLVSRALDISLESFPVAVFFDSFSDTRSVGLYEFTGKDHESLNGEIKFIVERVHRYWKAIPNIKDKKGEMIVQERRNCIDALEPQIRLRKLKNFVVDNKRDINKIVSWLTKPFAGL